MTPARGTALAVLLIAGGVRIVLLERQGLWPDEVFSLAVATGHSLEHPATQADASQGDFVEGEQPRPATEYRRYLEHEPGGGGLRGVLRAVLRSDTSPPLYYLLLHVWTKAVGTSDASLRALSAILALLCLPLIHSLARRLGGRHAATPACLLFALAPLAVYYSTEGRMYSMVWMLVLAVACLVLRLRVRGPARLSLVLFVLTSAAGFLTHYFFVFPWLALWSWLLCHPGRRSRGTTVAVGLAAALTVLPWYVKVPETLGAWRVTGDWLKMRPEGYSALLAPFEMPLRLVSGRGVWGGGPRADWAAAALSAVLAAVLLYKLRRRAVQGPRLLLWLWLIASCLGPICFDLLRGTYTGAVERYAASGLPAALLLMATALGRLRPPVRWSLLLIIVAAWSPGLRDVFKNRSRCASPLREVGQELGRRTSEFDLVLIHSIPSGVVGVARYLDGPAGVAAWVGQLGQRRVPESIETLAAGRRRIFLVLVHTVGEPAPQETYLRDNAAVVDDVWRQTARIIEFRPRAGDTLFP